MNNTSNSNSKAKLITILASLVVILALLLAFTFILKQHQNKVIKLNGDMDIDYDEYNTQQNTPKDIKTTVQDSAYKEADQQVDEAEAGDMNEDTSEGADITDKMKEYNESPESTVTEEDNTAEWTEEPKQEEVYVPAAEPEVDNTPAPEPTPAPEDNSNSNSGSDDNFWGGLDTNQDINWDSEKNDFGGLEKDIEWHY